MNQGDLIEHSAMPRIVLPLVVILFAACARNPAPHAPPSPYAATESVAAAEEAEYRRRADSLRRVILEQAEWVDLGRDSCNPGTFRSFRRDSTDTLLVKRSIEKLERAIVVSGVELPLTERVSHDLLRTIIAWEADFERPMWDVAGNEPPRRAMAPALGGEFVNANTGACDRFVPLEGQTFVIPDVGRFDAPRAWAGKAQVVVGDEGLKAARDRFFATHTEADPIFTYTRLAPIVVWGDYALATVNRPAELRGTQRLPTGAGGATYLFHRVGNQWRLLAFVRAWA